MEDKIFDISFEEGGMKYTGWVNPSEKSEESGRPVSYHVVLNGTSFGHLSYNGSKWTVNEQRPDALVAKVGAQIDAYFPRNKENQRDEVQ